MADAPAAPLSYLAAATARLPQAPAGSTSPAGQAPQCCSTNSATSSTGPDADATSSCASTLPNEGVPCSPPPATAAAAAAEDAAADSGSGSLSVGAAAEVSPSSVNAGAAGQHGGSTEGKAAAADPAVKLPWWLQLAHTQAQGQAQQEQQPVLAELPDAQLTMVSAAAAAGSSSSSSSNTDPQQHAPTQQPEAVGHAAASSPDAGSEAAAAGSCEAGAANDAAAGAPNSSAASASNAAAAAAAAAADGSDAAHSPALTATGAESKATTSQHAGKPAASSSNGSSSAAPRGPRPIKTRATWRPHPRPSTCPAHATLGPMPPFVPAMPLAAPPLVMPAAPCPMPTLPGPGFLLPGPYGPMQAVPLIMSLPGPAGAAGSAGGYLIGPAGGFLPSPVTQPTPGTPAPFAAGASPAHPAAAAAAGAGAPGVPVAAAHFSPTTPRGWATLEPHVLPAGTQPLQQWVQAQHGSGRGRSRALLSQRPSTAAGGVRAAARPAAAAAAAAAMPVQPPAALLQDDVRPLMVYCHMSHARKQQPQLDKATVKKLVAAQVSAAAPFLPHWYRHNSRSGEAHSRASSSKTDAAPGGPSCQESLGSNGGSNGSQVQKEDSSPAAAGSVGARGEAAAGLSKHQLNPDAKPFVSNPALPTAAAAVATSPCHGGASNSAAQPLVVLSAPSFLGTAMDAQLTTDTATTQDQGSRSPGSSSSRHSPFLAAAAAAGASCLPPATSSAGAQAGSQQQGLARSASSSSCSTTTTSSGGSPDSLGQRRSTGVFIPRVARVGSAAAVVASPLGSTGGQHTP